MRVHYQYYDDYNLSTSLNTAVNLNNMGRDRRHRIKDGIGMKMFIAVGWRNGMKNCGALHQAWSDAAQASRRAAALERRLHETRSGSGRHLGRSLGFCWGTTGVPMRIFGGDQGSFG